MSQQKQIRAAYYLRASTESQELQNQRAEIVPFIENRGWRLVHTFEDSMSGRKTDKDRPGFAAMLKAAHQRKFDIIVFWALDRLTREGTRATLNYLQRLESKGVGYVSYQEQWLDSTGPFKDVMVSMFATLARRSGQRAENSVSDGLRINAKDRCLRAVHRNVQLRCIVRLLDPEIHSTRDLTNLVHEITRELEVSLFIGPDD